MTIEDRLRSAIANRTNRVEPSPDALEQIQEKLMSAQGTENRTRWLIGIGSAAAAAALVVGVFALSGDDDPEVDTADTTSTTEATTTTTEATTTTETTVVEPGPVDPTLPIFPDPATSRRFDSPIALVTSFATDMVGMTSPIVGDLAEGDSRSGEVEVRAFADGQPTTVLVRQLEDNTWFVIGAVTESIQPTTPDQGATVSSPLELTGSAYAFEGTVDVKLYADGTVEPIATSFVTGRGDGELGEYSGQLEFTPPAGAEHGVLLYTSGGGEDGAPIAAAAIRVHFG